MPSAFVQIACDNTLTTLHEHLVKQRAVVAASSKVSESACAYVRMQVKENAVSSTIAITRPMLDMDERQAAAATEASGSQQVSLTPAPTLVPTATAAAKGRKKGAKVMSSDEVAALFANDDSTEAKHYILVLHAAFLSTILPNLDEMFTEILEMWSDRPNASSSVCVFEVCIVGKHKGKSLQGPVTASLLKVFSLAKKKVEKYQENIERAQRTHAATSTSLSEPPPCLPIDSFVVLIFNTEKEVGDRALHVAMYYSQLKDAKVRPEIHQGVKKKVDTDDMHRLYIASLCEIPTVSERRAQVIASTLPTLASLLAAVAKDDGSFEKALADATEFGEHRRAGDGLAAAIKVAVTTEYVTDAQDQHLAALRYQLHKSFGLIPPEEGEAERSDSEIRLTGSARKPQQRPVSLSSSEEDADEFDIRGSGPLFAGLGEGEGTASRSFRMGAASLSPTLATYESRSDSLMPSATDFRAKKPRSTFESEVTDEDEFSCFGLESLVGNDRRAGSKAPRDEQ